MKKILTLLLALTILLSCAACASEKPAPTTEAPTTEAPTTEATTTETPTTEAPTTEAPTTEATTTDGDTMGQKYVAAFNESTSTDVLEVANELVEKGISEASLVVTEMEPGWFPGFDEDITGFTKAASFAPMIGTIPFAGYVFEVENPEEFLNTISAVANPRWNICTEADETVTAIRGNLVLFLMCRNSEF